MHKMKGIFFTSGGIHVATMLGMAEAYDLSNVDVVGGISAGGILATFLGSSDDPREGLSNLKSIITSNHIQRNFRFLNLILSLLFKGALFHDNNLRGVLSAHLTVPKRRIMLGVSDETDMSYKLMDFIPGEHMSMPLVDACVATMSVPGAFPGVNHEHRHYIDGGIFHALPIEAIERTINLAKEKNERLELVIFSAYPWGWAPEMSHHKYLQIPHQLMHLVECVPTVNLYHDQRMLHKLLADAKASIDIDFRVFMLPSKLATQIYKEHSPTSWDKCSPEVIQKLVNIGRDLVETVMKHTAKD